MEDPMAMTRRRFVAAAGVSVLGVLAARAAQRLETAVAAAAPALRPSSRGTSAGRCALCGSTAHSTLAATCAEAAERRREVQVAASRIGARTGRAGV
jgi:hypothetical protein